MKPLIKKYPLFFCYIATWINVYEVRVPKFSRFSTSPHWFRTCVIDEGGREIEIKNGVFINKWIVPIIISVEEQLFDFAVITYIVKVCLKIVARNRMNPSIFLVLVIVLETAKGVKHNNYNRYCRLPCDFVDHNVTHTVCKRNDEVSQLINLCWWLESVWMHFLGTDCFYLYCVLLGCTFISLN